MSDNANSSAADNMSKTSAQPVASQANGSDSKSASDTDKVNTPQVVASQADGSTSKSVSDTDKVNTPQVVASQADGSASKSVSDTDKVNTHQVVASQADGSTSKSVSDTDNVNTPQVVASQADGSASKSVSDTDNVNTAQVETTQAVTTHAVAPQVGATQTITGNVQSARRRNMVIVPYVGHNAPFYTQDTPPSQFSDWPSYLIFCITGPKARVIIANDACPITGQILNYHSYDISKKLFCDFSPYFNAALNGGWEETHSGEIIFDDMQIEDFARLDQRLQAGSPAARTNMGAIEDVLSTMLRVYKLADFLRVTNVTEWIKIDIQKQLIDNENWSAAYTHQVLQQPAMPGVANSHRERIIDLSDFYVMLTTDILPIIQPIKELDFLDWVLDFAPRQLMADMIRARAVDAGFAQDLCARSLSRGL